MGQDRVPKTIDFGLIGTVDHEGDGVGVFHAHAAVERGEPLTGERELHHDDVPGLAVRIIGGAALDGFDFGIR